MACAQHANRIFAFVCPCYLLLLPAVEPATRSVSARCAFLWPPCVLQELTLDSGPGCVATPSGFSFAYLTRLRRLTLLERAVYGLQVRLTLTPTSTLTLTPTPTLTLTPTPGPTLTSTQTQTLTLPEP